MRDSGQKKHTDKTKRMICTHVSRLGLRSRFALAFACLKKLKYIYIACSACWCIIRDAPINGMEWDQLSIQVERNVCLNL